MNTAETIARLGRPKPKTVAEYIDTFPPDARKRLKEMRACLRRAAPRAKESLKWNMPALSDDRILFMYAAFKNHLSLFPTPQAVRAFAGKLGKYQASGGAIKFPLDKPLPVALIGRIAKFRVGLYTKRDARWIEGRK